MPSIFTTIYDSPAGQLLIGDFEGKLCLCDWQYRRMRKSIDNRIQKGLKAAYEEKETPLHKECIAQLNAYFAEERKNFDLPLKWVGTEFQQSVWQALIEIPYGETRSYLELSAQLGNTKAIRAVASANGANALSIIVPCHRIIGADGSLVGYAGGIPAKKKLLKLENAPALTAQLELF